MAERLRGPLLIAAVMAPWLGEGAAWAALALLGGAVLLRRPKCAWRSLAQSPSFAPYLAALAALLIALLAPGLPWHAAGLGRLMPWAVLPLTWVATRSVSPVWAERAAKAVLVAAALAAAWGAVSMAADASFFERYVRLDGATANQGHVPGSTARVMGGFYFHRLKMAHALLVGLGYALAVCLMPRAARTRARAACAWLVFAGLFVALALTYTRAALLAGLLASAVCLMAHIISPRAAAHQSSAHTSRGKLRKPSVVAIGMAALVGACALGVPSVRTRLLLSGGRDAHQVRAVIWRQAVDIIATHPLGVGLGQYPQYAAAAYARRDPLTLSPRTYPHHTLLGLWAEGGPIAALGMLMAWSAAVTRAWCTMRRVDGVVTDVQRAALASLFALVALFVVGLLHDVLFHQSVALVAFSALGVWCARSAA